MISVAFYPAFLGTFLSIIGLCYLAINYHSPDQHCTLSQLAAEQKHTLTLFRVILWVCGSLFTLTLAFFIAPQINSILFAFVVWATYLCEVFLGVFAAREGRELHFHNIFSYGMAVGMLLMTVLLAVNLSGSFAIAEVVLAVPMFVLGLLGIFNKQNFLFYELPFIFLSHISVLIAAIALR